MTSIWAIIPVKRLGESKQRLSLVLTAAERAELMLALLENLLRVLAAVPEVERMLVVTADERVGELAASLGAKVLAERAPYGLNSAISQGRDFVAENGATAALVLPADLPFVRPNDIDLMLEPLREGTEPLAVICSDEAGEGTNGLLLAPPQGYTFHFGPASYGLHCAEARRMGRETVLVRAPGLRFDLDNEGDWLLYSERPIGTR